MYYACLDFRNGVICVLDMLSAKKLDSFWLICLLDNHLVMHIGFSCSMFIVDEYVC